MFGPRLKSVNFGHLWFLGLLVIITNDEEQSFWLLKHIVESVVPQYHTKNMANLLRDLAVFKELVIRRVPDVNRHIENLGKLFYFYSYFKTTLTTQLSFIGLPYAVIASKWFICIFAEVLPVETVLRIWDCVFAEGYKVSFTIIKCYYDKSGGTTYTLFL